jgi:hypothetical protein
LATQKERLRTWLSTFNRARINRPALATSTRSRSNQSTIPEVPHGCTPGRRTGLPDKTARIRTVSGESEHVDDDSVAYLAHIEAGWRNRRICSLRSDIAGLPHRFRAGNLTIGDTQMVWQPSLSLRRRKIVLPPLDSVLAIRPWGGPGEGKFNYRRKVAVTSGPSGVIEFALGGVGAELVRRFVQPNAPRANADPDGT